MNQVPIPDKIKRFIWLGIPSVPYLEAILLIRDRADKSWDYEEIARRLYLGEAAVQALLVKLFTSGVIMVDAHTPQRFRLCVVAVALWPHLGGIIMMINTMLGGAIVMASLTIALFFLHFWKSTRDRFFLYFALSFALEAVNRILFLVPHSTDGVRTDPRRYS